MPLFLLPLLSFLWRFKADLVTAAAVVLAIAFASPVDRYLIAFAVVLAYILGHRAGSK